MRFATLCPIFHFIVFRVTLSCTLPPPHVIGVLFQVQNLLVVMSEMSKDDKRLFLRFISGSPRLPLGGFAGLSPRLTIVKAVATLGAFSAAPAAARAALVVPARFVVNKLDAYCFFSRCSPR